MAVTIKKTLPTKKVGRPKKKVKKPITPIKGLEDTLERYHLSSDTELNAFIEPEEAKAGNKSHRLSKEQLDARYVLLHRMMIRKVPIPNICKALQISLPMYYKLRTQLQSRLRIDTSRIDVPYLIGDTLAFYDEVRSMALTMSTSVKINDNRVKLNAMSVALKAESDKNQFLITCGIYSTPVVEWVIKSMAASGAFNSEDSARVLDAEEVNLAIVDKLKRIAIQRNQVAAELEGLGIVEGEYYDNQPTQFEPYNPDPPPQNTPETDLEEESDSP